MDNRPPPTDDEVQLCSRLLSLAAHELRTPISVVGGYLRMLQHDRDSIGERQQRMIDEAEKACARLVAIVSELSDIGKLDDGRTKLQAEPLDVFGLVRDVAGKADEAAERGVRLVIRGETGAASLRGDRVHLNTVFAALLKAVLREQQDSTVVVVDLRRQPDGSALIVIAREPDADIATTRPPATFDELRGGLGLALPVARRVIERHRGRIWSPASADGTPSARSAILVSLPIEAEN